MDFFQRILELWAKIPNFGWKNPWKWTFYYFTKILNLISDQKFPVNWVFRWFSWVFWEFFAWVLILLEFFSLEFFLQMRNNKPAIVLTINRKLHFCFMITFTKPCVSARQLLLNDTLNNLQVWDQDNTKSEIGRLLPVHMGIFFLEAISL